MSDARDEVDDLIDEAARGLVARDAPADLRARVQTRLLAGDGGTHGRGWVWPGLVAAAAAAVIAVALRVAPATAPRPPKGVAAPTAAAGPVVANTVPPNDAALEGAPAARGHVRSRVASTRARARPHEANPMDAGPMDLAESVEPEPLRVAPQDTDPLAVAALEISPMTVRPLDAISELDSVTEER